MGAGGGLETGTGFKRRAEGSLRASEGGDAVETSPEMHVKPQVYLFPGLWWRPAVPDDLRATVAALEAALGAAGAAAAVDADQGDQLVQGRLETVVGAVAVGGGDPGPFLRHSPAFPLLDTADGERRDSPRPLTERGEGSGGCRQTGCGCPGRGGWHPEPFLRPDTAFPPFLPLVGVCVSDC